MKEKILTAIAIALLAGAAFGFFVGRQTISLTVSEKKVKGETVSGIQTVRDPVREVATDAPEFPVKRDTVWRDSIAYVYQTVDTAAIIAEYQLKRFYETTLFDNNRLGKLDVSLSMQYNRLGELSYNFTPYYTVKTVEKMRVWIPFVSASYSTLGHVGIGGGLFYHDVGLQVRYTTDSKHNGFDIGVLYKF